MFLGGKQYQELGNNCDGTTEDTADLSLVTGQVRVMPDLESSSDNIPTSGVVAVKGDSTVSTHLATGSEFLSKRSWQGLEQNLGQKDAVLASKGRSGVPQNYDTDIDNMC
jgi:hypothetical protein